MASGTRRHLRAGVTLTESLVALAFLGIGLAAFVSFIGNQSRADAEIAADEGLDDLEIAIRTSLIDPQTCKQTMQNRQAATHYILSGETADGIRICHFSAGACDAVSPSIVSAPGKTINGFTVLTQKIELEARTTSREYVYRLEITAKNPNGAVRSREVYFKAKTDGATSETILDCPDPMDLTQYVNSSLCDNNMGHFKNRASTTATCQNKFYGGYGIAPAAATLSCPSFNRYFKDTDGQIFKFVVQGTIKNCQCLIGTVKSSAVATTNYGGSSSTFYNMNDTANNPSLPIDVSLAPTIDTTQAQANRDYRNPGFSTGTASVITTPSGWANLSNTASYLPKQQVTSTGAPIGTPDPEDYTTTQNSCSCDWGADIPTTWPAPTVLPPASIPTSCNTAAPPLDCFGHVTAYCEFNNEKLQNGYTTPSAAAAAPAGMPSSDD